MGLALRHHVLDGEIPRGGGGFFFLLLAEDAAPLGRGLREDVDLEPFAEGVECHERVVSRDVPRAGRAGGAAADARRGFGQRPRRRERGELSGERATTTARGDAGASAGRTRGARDAIAVDASRAKKAPVERSESVATATSRGRRDVAVPTPI